MGYKEPTTIGNLISTSISSIVGNRSSSGLLEQRVINCWKEILGAKAVYSCNESFVNGTLDVHIESSILRNELYLYKESYKTLINNKFSNDIVLNIIIR
ncbi:MAG: DciA family protein [Bacteroidales bacterium]|nr:DUF721 domain-containing protein [Bacteroidales bacterium]MDD5975118.1 DciA family protein [Bacteroidales bacterium]MDY5194014.1 DciA family protein [Candidatus Aphodosoma sp.]